MRLVERRPGAGGSGGGGVADSAAPITTTTELRRKAGCVCSFVRWSVRFRWPFALGAGPTEMEKESDGRDWLEKAERGPQGTD